MPWSYNPIPGYQFVVRVEDEINGLMLVAAHVKLGHEKEARRVLTLASAAPELYAALVFMFNCGDSINDRTRRQARAQARAALLKANPERKTAE